MSRIIILSTHLQIEVSILHTNHLPLYGTKYCYELLIIFERIYLSGRPHGVVVNVLVSNIFVIKFEN